jgi:hypothetical protein
MKFYIRICTLLFQLTENTEMHRILRHILPLKKTQNVSLPKNSICLRQAQAPTMQSLGGKMIRLVVNLSNLTSNF